MENILAGVQHPVHYIGGEHNSIVKDWQSARARMAFCFPDTYEIGMSHLGLRILYEAVNREDGLLMERCFCPREDMRENLLEQKKPLKALESGRPLADFDVIGFTLQYELSYTNVLDMLNMAHIPLLAAERAGLPLVIAGGPCAYNPEPLADFIDVFCIGEGEEQLPALLRLVAQVKEADGDKVELLRLAQSLPGCYVPALYQPGQRVQKAIVRDLDSAPFPAKPILPHTQVVHDRIMLEIMRGCGRGCRFCQAGIIYRPVREKSPQTLIDQAAACAAHSGYEDMGLISLSSADYSQIAPLMKELIARHSPCGMGVSLPSLRVDAFSVGLASQASQVRKSGLTFAPEAGSQRLRDIINKGVTEEDIMAALSAAFSQGYTSVKLYFMIGLPCETMEDIEAIADLCRRVIPLYRAHKPAYVKKPLKISLGVASFVPKAHTPFQWCAQDSPDLLKEKQARLLQLIRPLKQVSLRYHDTKISLLEAAFARGDRRLGPVLLTAWQNGCRADGWSEHFKPDTWQVAFAAQGLSPEQFACRAYAKDEALPWQHVESGVSTEWLWSEYEKALAAMATVDCRGGDCYGCGVCPSLDVELKLAGESAGLARRFDTLAQRELPLSARGEDLPAVGTGEKHRLRLSVQGKMRWLSHLDMLDTMAKALRRAALPVAFSQGFNPHMLISWGPAHAVGLAGDSEYLDITFAAAPPADWLERLNAVLPTGLRVLAAAPLAPGTPALMAAINRADYAVEVAGAIDDEAIAALLASASCAITREGPKGRKQVDIRPALLSLSREGQTLYFSCRLDAGAAPKPAEIARITAPGAAIGEIRREALYIDGVEPLVGAPGETDSK